METDHSKCVLVCVHVSRLTIRLDEFIFLSQQNKTRKKIQGFIIFKFVYFCVSLNFDPKKETRKPGCKKKSL